MAKLLLHLPVLHRFGFHHDELYFVACGQHLAFGYVDHAPLVPWIARLATTLFGQSLFGLRSFAVLAGALAIFLVCRLAARLGGGPYAQLLAGLALLVAPVFLRTGNMLAIPSFEPLFWLGGALLLLRLVEEDNPRLWLWLGLIVGVGLMNKHSMLFFGFGTGVGMLLTPLRRHLRTPWPWLGAGVALLVFLPNIIWQVHHGWPTASFLRTLNETVMSGVSRIQFVLGQFLYLNPLASFVWVCGLVFLFSRDGRRYRVLGWIWLSIFLLLLVTGSKIYYLAPAFPPLIAAGGVAIERFIARRNAPWLRVAAIAPVLLGGLLLGPVSVPYLSIQATDRYVNAVTLGKMGNVYELTGDLHGMFGWPERVAAVAEVWGGIPSEERPTALLLAAGYGNAGAIDHLGRAAGLPRAVSFSKTYWMWGYAQEEPETVVAVDFRVAFLEQIWEDVQVVKSIDLADVNPSATPFEIAICRQPKMTMGRLWEQVRPW